MRISKICVFSVVLYGGYIELNDIVENMAKRRAHFCLYIYAAWDDVKHIRHIISRGAKGVPV